MKRGLSVRNENIINQTKLEEVNLLGKLADPAIGIKQSAHTKKIITRKSCKPSLIAYDKENEILPVIVKDDGVSSAHHESSNALSQVVLAIFEVLGNSSNESEQLAILKRIVTPAIYHYLQSYNHENEAGKNFLYIASEHGCLNIIKFLVIDVSLSTIVLCSNGDSVLHISAKKGFIELLRFFLLEQKMNPNMLHMKSKNTALHEACLEGQEETVKFILTLPSVDVNIQNIRGESPLHIACSQGLPSIVTRLIEDGNADVFLKDIDGRTPAELALFINRNILSLIKETYCSESAACDNGGLHCSPGAAHISSHSQRHNEESLSSYDYSNATTLNETSDTAGGFDTSHVWVPKSPYISKTPPPPTTSTVESGALLLSPTVATTLLSPHLQGRTLSAAMATILQSSSSHNRLSPQVLREIILSPAGSCSSSSSNSSTLSSITFGNSSFSLVEYPSWQSQEDKDNKDSQNENDDNTSSSSKMKLLSILAYETEATNNISSNNNNNDNINDVSDVKDASMDVLIGGMTCSRYGIDKPAAHISISSGPSGKTTHQVGIENYTRQQNYVASPRPAAILSEDDEEEAEFHDLYHPPSVAASSSTASDTATGTSTSSRSCYDDSVRKDDYLELSEEARLLLEDLSIPLEVLRRESEAARRMEEEEEEVERTVCEDMSSGSLEPPIQPDGEEVDWSCIPEEDEEEDERDASYKSGDEVVAEDTGGGGDILGTALGNTSASAPCQSYIEKSNDGDGGLIELSGTNSCCCLDDQSLSISMVAASTSISLSNELDEILRNDYDLIEAGGRCGAVVSEDELNSSEVEEWSLRLLKKQLHDTLNDMSSICVVASSKLQMDIVAGEEDEEELSQSYVVDDIICRQNNSVIEDDVVGNNVEGVGPQLICCTTPITSVTALSSNEMRSSRRPISPIQQQEEEEYGGEADEMACRREKGHHHGEVVGHEEFVDVDKSVDSFASPGDKNTSLRYCLTPCTPKPGFIKPKLL